MYKLLIYQPIFIFCGIFLGIKSYIIPWNKYVLLNRNSIKQLSLFTHKRICKKYLFLSKSPVKRYGEYEDQSEPLALKNLSSKTDSLNFNKSN